MNMVDYSMSFLSLSTLVVVSGLQDFRVSPNPLGPNWVLKLVNGQDLVRVWPRGFGQGGLGAKILKPGLDNFRFDKIMYSTFRRRPQFNIKRRRSKES